MRIGKCLALMASLVTSLVLSIGAAFAVDANTASRAELESVKGIGPALSARIIDERKKGAYKDLGDLEARVKGIGESNARKFAAAGLTVGGSRGSARTAAAASASTTAARPEVIKGMPATASTPTAAKPAARTAPEVKSPPVAAPIVIGSSKGREAVRAADTKDSKAK